MQTVGRLGLEGFEESKFSGPNGSLAHFKIEPKAGTTSLVLVCAHGGPGGDGRGNGNIFPILGRSLAELGVATITFDFFGNGNSDGSNLDCNLSTQIADLEAVYEDARNSYDLPVCVCGESLGATIVRAATLNKLAGEILLWPAFDLTDTDLRDYFSKEWRDRVSEHGLLEDGDFRLGRQYYMEMLEWDYGRLFDLNRCPTLIAHGGMDDEVPASQSIKAMGKTKVSTHFHYYPEGQHGLRDDKIRQDLYAHIKTFLSSIE